MARKRYTRKRRVGGKVGTLKRMMNYEASSIIGAGGYGIVLNVGNGHKDAVKLFKDTDTCHAIVAEARIQQRCHQLFKGTEIAVPAVTFYSQTPIDYKQTRYLCGIGMEYLPPPLDFDEQVHMALGYTGSDLDSSWAASIKDAISPDNPTRGFFASADTMTYIWAQEGSSMTLEKMSYLMGHGFRSMIDAGIVQIDLEWVWSKGSPWIIDFGLCYEGAVDPETFLLNKGSEGLGSDFYWPRNDAFLAGYFRPPATPSPTYTSFPPFSGSSASGIRANQTVSP